MLSIKVEPEDTYTWEEKNLSSPRKHESVWENEGNCSMTRAGSCFVEGNLNGFKKEEACNLCQEIDHSAITNAASAPSCWVGGGVNGFKKEEDEASDPSQQIGIEDMAVEVTVHVKEKESETEEIEDEIALVSKHEDLNLIDEGCQMLHSATHMILPAETSLPECMDPQSSSCALTPDEDSYIFQLDCPQQQESLTSGRQKDIACIQSSKKVKRTDEPSVSIRESQCQLSIVKKSTKTECVYSCYKSWKWELPEIDWPSKCQFCEMTFFTKSSWKKHQMIHTVPPRVSLSYDNVTLTNASYHKEHGYKTYFGGNNPYVAEREVINVTCLAEEAKPQANITWMINGRVVDNVLPQETQRNPQENRTFDSISTLQFTPIGEEVNITCNVSLDGTDIKTSANAKLLTYVLPRIFFLLNSRRVDSTVVYVGQGETVNITCYAEGSRPSANLSWEENYDNLQSSLQERLNVNNETFDTILTLTTSPESDVERITCRSSIDEINKISKVDLKIHTYVLREPSITFNGKSWKVIPVDKNDNVTLICSAADSTPIPTLTWKINEELLQDGTSEVSSSAGSSNLVFQPKEKDIAECVSYLAGPNITLVAKVSFDFSEDTASFNYILNVIVPCIAATVTIFLVLCVYSASRRIKGSGPADFSALQLALRSRPVNGVNNISRDLPSIRRSMVIPTDDDNIEINCEEDKTSAVTNVELGVHLPGEGTFQYWTACASVKNENSKKIIAKCVSESVQMKEHMNFRTLAENLKTLTTHRNIIEIIGVSVTSVPYYIYMEYLEYGTLRDFLMRNYQQSSNSQTNIAQTLDERAIHLTGFALDVADGLIYLTDRDYRHPALCARKILLTKTGTCKLYDFWPKALSTERIHQILQKSHPPVAWLSPETIFLRHYFEKSDVWNFGVVLWEIYSLGEIPYGGLTCEEIEQEIRKMHYLDQPLTCPGGIFSMMLASWDTTVDDRPDLSEWKQKLDCLLQSARQELDDKNSTEGSGDQSYFTLENNVCDYEDDYIEQ